MAWQKTQPLNGGKLAGWRELAVQVKDITGELRGISYETIRLMHAGRIEWVNLRLEVLVALAEIYGTTLAKLSPQHVKRNTHHTQGRRNKTCETANSQTVSPVAA